jgi:molybdopterin-guanine dinucleotide biosynthesis protein A
MGAHKALIEIGGKPLVAHAVEKLQRICADVYILSSDPVLEPFAPLVPDLHMNCGPLGGIEAALAHSRFDWNLVLPVDVPFLPKDFLLDWIQRITKRDGVRAAYFEVAGKPEPGVLLIRREAQSSIRSSIERGEFKLLPAIQASAEASRVWVELLDTGEAEEWFANLNTPEELERIRGRADLQHMLGAGDGAS